MRSPGRAFLLPFLAAVLAVLLAPAAVAVPPAPPVIEPPEGQEALVLRFTQGFGEMAGGHALVFEIWGDGRAVLRRPAIMQGPQEVEVFLRGNEVQAILTGLEQRGVFAFDSQGAREALRDARRQRLADAIANPGEVTLQAWSDPDPTRLEVNLACYGPRGDAESQQDLSVVIDWSGLLADARVHPEVAPVRELAAAQADLARVMARPEFR